jgi:YVTN family beta-propeller protein
MGLRRRSAVWAAVLALIVCIGLLCGGCGDYFRPVANPVPQPGGDPQRTAHALVASSNGADSGSVVIIDTTGDADVASYTVGRTPVHAGNLSGTDYVVNMSDNSVNALLLPPAGSPLNPSNTIITLPGPPPASTTPASPVFVATAQSKVFVAESGRNSVAVIDPSSNSLVTELAVGNTPVALVPTPDGTKLYCLNKGDSTITVILPSTNQVFATISANISSPVWGAVSADGTRVFVLNQGANNVAIIDTTSDATGDSVIGSFPVGPGGKYVIYDPTLNRAYVASPGDQTLTIFDNNLGCTAAPPGSTLPLACTAQAVSMAGSEFGDGVSGWIARLRRRRRDQQRLLLEHHQQCFHQEHTGGHGAGVHCFRS